MSHRKSETTFKYLTKSYTLPFLGKKRKKPKRKLKKSAKVNARFDTLCVLFRENKMLKDKYNQLYSQFAKLPSKEQRRLVSCINRGMIIMEKQKNPSFDLELYITG